MPVAMGLLTTTQPSTVSAGHSMMTRADIAVVER